jgi:GNAT superfamily N-acetyltransferase
VEEEVEYFLGADVHCQMLVEEGKVVGYCTFGRDARVPGGDYSAEAVDIGLGVEPSRTGSGDGRRFVAAVVDRAKEMFSPELLRVTIAAGNQRALRVWSNAGFGEVTRFATDQTLMGSNEFVILVRKEEAQGPP